MVTTNIPPTNVPQATINRIPPTKAFKKPLPSTVANYVFWKDSEVDCLVKETKDTSKKAALRAALSVGRLFRKIAKSAASTNRINYYAPNDTRQPVLVFVSAKKDIAAWVASL